MPYRVYADFNKQLWSRSASGLMTLVLTTVGTLRDLSAHRIRLSDGVVLTFYSDSAENEELEVEGTVRFERGVAGPYRECWVADYRSSDIRYVPAAPGTTPSGHPCFGCGADLAPMLREQGLSEESRCSECGIAVMTPVLPPVGA